MGALIDHERSTCLCDVGLPGYWLATCVKPDGDTVLWLVDRDELGGDNRCCGYGDDVAHEQLGPLPFEYAQRIAALDRRRGYRCGRRTRSGTVCRMRVTRPGDACEWHRGTP
ncbi:hypothetical protein BMW24_004510 [Mycobacterium heckeshornense]|uniref:Uncharacterized protein n=1 Tax=Mycobacterium heckeshornense TaxID=110505 RepID=A0A2G8BGS3_9MYCO|nr:hypothetical protein [Mycobacterium heckeshornense]KMV21252.1 hypothetical protein ACT16_17765 [Mycobacterium heckeshornense]MCV7035124.1 hypothetical protein [Mycobacterium heckeshornense]PIJ36960.1 hypothetical protein BMW24_004510 [Mycobacterium heckeshornense]BCO35260.1 hypothetical protein MHEC_16930 [Mycobacterium heckeshornense]BCQ07713.1 hypothetical protein JMUB5695_01134 [Mycobacterium heckeshornense]